jgi:tetratricopeptide (TPR) repeat protein
MNDNRMVEQFKLLKRAKKLEEMGSNDRALDLYLELHDKYDPNTSDAYERPAILLERAKRYEEALSLCQKAIEDISNDKMTGTVEKFEKRIQSIEKKMTVAPTPNQPKEKYHFGIIGFRTKKPIKMMLASLIYAALLASLVFVKTPYILLTGIGAIYGFGYMVDLLSTKSNVKKILFVLMILSFALTIFSITQIPSAFTEPIELESKEEHLEGGENIFTPKDDLPVITDEHIEMARELINSEIEVVESLIIVNDNQVTFGLLLVDTTSEDRAMDLSETFVEALSRLVASDEGIKGPSFGNLGELYDHYSVLISAGIDDQNILAKGQKSINSKYINWRD